MPGHVPVRALVVLRVARGAPAPTEAELFAALAADRSDLGLPAGQPFACRSAGPYAIEVGGRAVDEYVAWEV